MIKLYNSELQINLKISNIPIDLFSDIELFLKIKDSIKKLSYDIITEKNNKEKKVSVSPVLDVQMIFSEKNTVLNFIVQKPDNNSLIIVINPIIVEKFNLPISKVKRTIEILVNRIIENIISNDKDYHEININEDREKEKDERDLLIFSINKIEQKIKKYETLLANNIDNKKESDKIGNRLIQLNNELKQLKDKQKNEKSNENPPDFPFSNY